MPAPTGLQLRSPGRTLAGDTPSWKGAQASFSLFKAHSRSKSRFSVAPASMFFIIIASLAFFTASLYMSTFTFRGQRLQFKRLPDPLPGRLVTDNFLADPGRPGGRHGGHGHGSGIENKRDTTTGGGGTKSGAWALSRPPAAAKLEALVDGDPVLGACYQQQPMLSGMLPDACQPLTCLWSDTHHSNVDLHQSPLQLLPNTSESQTRCPPPQGGQRGLPEGTRPVVSFVIAMYNGGTVTAQCLLELFRTAREVESAEYVLVNDGSTEDVTAAVQTLRTLHSLFGIRHVYLETPKAEGFGGANSRGITAASGEFVALINNDMFVTKGWLHPLLHTFTTHPQAGLVGPLFMGNANLVQEAGGVVYSDGSAGNFGRNSEHSHLVAFARETDYISAACVVFRRDDFFRLGGFDSQDTDFAMAVRAAGKKVLLQPLSVVYHQEGGTFGTDETSDLKRQLMKENGRKFFHKVGGTAGAALPPSAGPLGAVARFGSPRILWIDDIVPEPDRDSGSIRTLNILRILLTQGYHVTFAATAPREPRYAAQLRSMGVDVLATTSPVQWTIGREGRCLYDVLYIARREVYLMAKDAVQSQCPQAPIIYDTVDFALFQGGKGAILAKTHPTQGAQDSQSATWPLAQVSTSHVLKWLNTERGPEAEAVRAKRDVELQLIAQSDVTVVVSSEEIDVIRHYKSDVKVTVLSNIHQIEPLPPGLPCQQRSGMLFVGNMNHIPNREAVEVLIQEVLPAILEAIPPPSAPGFMLHIVGSNIVPEGLMRLMEQHKSHVTFHGNLPDDKLWELYTQVRVVAAPLLSGAGVKGKVNQAMKYGIPVVATPLAVEGMHAEHERDCLLAQGPLSFASHVVKLHSDCQLWRRLVEGGLDNMRTHFSLEAAQPVVLQVFSAVGAAPLPPAERGKCRVGRV